MVYALIVSFKKLRLYFQEHTITVLTDQLIRLVLHRSDTSSQLNKWIIELEEFDIKYLMRPSIKAQALADFILECTILDEESGDESTTPTFKKCWILHVDGTSNTIGLGAELILISPR